MPAIDKTRIVIMATDGFEESELFGPREILIGRGCEILLAAPSLTPIQATVMDDPGRVIRPNLKISEVRAGDFDALILPGGVRNPDSLRTNDQAIALIKSFDEARKPIGAICHGPWLLVEADVLRGCRATSWPSIRTDVCNAGARWEDAPAVIDGHLVTSRAPGDVESFTAALIQIVEADLL